MVTLQGSNFGVSAIGRDIDGCMRYRNPEAMDITQCLAGTLSFLARDGHRGSQESGPQTHKSRAVCPGAPIRGWIFQSTSASRLRGSRSPSAMTLYWYPHCRSTTRIHTPLRQALSVPQASNVRRATTREPFGGERLQRNTRDGFRLPPWLCVLCVAWRVPSAGCVSGKWGADMCGYQF